MQSGNAAALVGQMGDETQVSKSVAPANDINQGSGTAAGPAESGEGASKTSMQANGDTNQVQPVTSHANHKQHLNYAETDADMQTETNQHRHARAGDQKGEENGP